MSKENLLNAVKVVIITLLVVAISMLAVLNWKSELIIDRVLASVQDQLVDSLRYSEAGMDWFSHFPSIAIQIDDLYLGSGETPLVQGGNLDVVIRLIPLLKGDIMLSKLQVANSVINLYQKDGRWSYDILKKSTAQNDAPLNTRINQLLIENTRLKYDDGISIKLNLAIAKGSLKGGMENNKLDLDIALDGSLDDMILDGYTLSEPFPFMQTGGYVFEMGTGHQAFKDWHIENEAIQLNASGTITRDAGDDQIDMVIAWKKANLDLLKIWAPKKLNAVLKQYTFSGEGDGELKIEGKSSAHGTPHIAVKTGIKNGAIRFLEKDEEIKGLNVEINYDNGGGIAAQKSHAEITFRKHSLTGASLEGKINIRNIENPVYDITLNGVIPSGMLNLTGIPGLHFDKGSFDVSHFELTQFAPASSTFSTFLQHAKVSCSVENISLTYLKNKILIPGGDWQLEDSQLALNLKSCSWNNATVSELKGSVVSKAADLAFMLDGKLCEGNVETKGTISGMQQRPVCSATWKVTGIEMKPLLESFSNFDQSFITSENLMGKANIRAETTIPFDEKWQIMTNKILVRSAIDIRDGQLRNMKTLEDFGAYVHLDDLRDIRFNQIRNYMKIENGIVYLPVMFIQSSALNLSISAEHSFNQDILYFIKLNAGQVAATKLKKNDVRKDFKKASKSGWINMYFVLNGKTSDVKYQQNRTSVIAGFEQSTMLKENLRNYLVDKFGYDVYWLEPNEWEDIPEYQ